MRSNPARIRRAARLVLDEAERASGVFPAFNSGHEGIAVIKEELDELWTEVKANALGTSDKMLEEAIQLGAMAVRFIADVCLLARPGPGLPEHPDPELVRRVALRIPPQREDERRSE